MKRNNNWTDQEDKLLLQLYNQADCFQKWKFISENFKKRGFMKNQIQCRERFVNKLNPELRQDKLENTELKHLFQYYDQYGPLWSVFESLIPGRNQNLLKNKFYSTLRSLVRILMLASEKNSNKKLNVSSTALSSKLLVQIYQGKKNFRKYKGVLRSILDKIGFQLDSLNIHFIQDKISLDIVDKIRQEITKSKSNKAKASLEKQSPGLKNQNPDKKFLQQLEKNQYSPCLTQESKQKIPQRPIVMMPSFQILSPCEAMNFNVFFPQSSPLTFLVPMMNYNMNIMDVQNKQQQ